ncbi:Transglycosylase SLT domain-containing protein [Rhizobium sp. NFACC06-2]|nr:Transglycosylase SLT domain-containing protein [Rhizobium sp. NFACC06-2]
MEDGASADPPSSSERMPAAQKTRLAQTRARSQWSSAILFDIGRAPVGQRKNIGRSARQPALAATAPRPLSMKFNSRQQNMRRMTVAVGLNYSAADSVKRARIDGKLFAALFTAMIHRESNFDPNAVSPVGAQGLGQLMPGTARELGVENAFSASENLDGAARYLTSMLDKFGSAELALAAYNAGPGAVQKYGGVPPYRETQQYIVDIFHAVGRKPSFAADASSTPAGKTLARRRS